MKPTAAYDIVHQQGRKSTRTVKMNQLALKAASQNVHDEAAAQAPLANDLKDRRSQELVFALVGPLGSGWALLHKLLRDSSCESNVVAGRHEQTDTPRLQDQELARL
ncbi:hypothetical protein [Tabrizicola sp.]|uniref:hypothetical protein n=1 Tax=Tabrizicola sp. TaxID=2005166 RepID=UPI0035ADD555